jgi:hypothetical protein
MIKAVFASLLVVSATVRAQSPPASQPESPLEVILKIIPADAQAGIVVPNIKYASDQITQCLEGMDRANLLLGSRPLDQMKSSSGFTVGIDDVGSLAIILAGDNAKPLPLFIIPVNDAEAFMSGNFATRNADACTTAAGRTMYVKPIDSRHIVMSADAAATRSFQSGEGVRHSLKSALGERGSKLLASGEIVLFGRQDGVRRLADSLQQQAKTARNMPPIPEGLKASILDSVDAAMLALDFDPLGLVIHSMGRVKDGSAFASVTSAAKAGSNALGLLPNKPFYFAASIDITALGGAEPLAAMAKLLGMPEPPAWLAQAQSIQFAAYPSPAGLTGGLLNDAVAVVRTPQPAAAKSQLKEFLLASQNGADGITRQVKWEDEKALEGIGTVAAYEVKVLDVPPERAQQQMLWQFLFGRGGCRGYISQSDDALIMTFSQRPAVLQTALAAARADTAQAAGNLAAAPAIKTMRQWMPPRTVADGYLGLGQIAQLVKQAMESMGMAGGGAMPEIDAGLPPIGLGMNVADRGIETCTVVPSGVLALMLDQAMQQMASRGQNPPQNEP